MFGIAIASLEDLCETEKKRYESIYCGICFELKNNYGQVARTSLNYDLAFLAMLYMSLYEPNEQHGYLRCVSHPKDKKLYTISSFTSYCTDLTVAFAYHKCLDDVLDDGSNVAKAGAKALESAYEHALQRIPIQCEMIEEAMSTTRRIENSSSSTPDEAAQAFGYLLGAVFECCPLSIGKLWDSYLFELGFQLGRLIYLMDAAIDFSDDLRAGSYNPFVDVAKSEAQYNLVQNNQATTKQIEPDPIWMREVLSDIAFKATEAFEKLPLVQDIHTMRSVLYSGVWQKFNKKYHKVDSRIFITSKTNNR